MAINLAQQLQNFLGDQFAVQDISPTLYGIKGENIKQEDMVISIRHRLGDGKVGQQAFLLQPDRDYECNDTPFDTLLSGLKNL